MNRLLKLLTVGLLFIAPFIILIIRYSEEKVVEVTERSMPLWVLAITSIIAIIFILWLFSQTMAKIKEQPFGWGSLVFFGGLILITLVMGFVWSLKFEDLIIYKSAELLQDIAYFKTTLQIIAPFTTVGVGLIAYHYIRELKK